MDIKKSVDLLKRARMETSDATMHQVFRMLTELVNEVSLARAEVWLIQIRLEELENPRDEEASPTPPRGTQH